MTAPLSEDAMDDIIAELPIWASELVHCSLCDYRHVSVHIADIERVECPKCGHMTPVEIFPEDLL